MTNVTIYVKLLNEDIDVLRPVKAKYIKNNIYMILDKNNEIDDEYGERLQFNQNDVVECEESKGSLYAKRIHKEIN